MSSQGQLFSLLFSVALIPNYIYTYIYKYIYSRRLLGNKSCVFCLTIDIKLFYSRCFDTKTIRCVFTESCSLTGITSN